MKTDHPRTADLFRNIAHLTKSSFPDVASGAGIDYTQVLKMIKDNRSPGPIPTSKLFKFMFQEDFPTAKPVAEDFLNYLSERSKYLESKLTPKKILVFLGLRSSTNITHGHYRYILALGIMLAWRFPFKGVRAMNLHEWNCSLKGRGRMRHATEHFFYLPFSPLDLFPAKREPGVIEVKETQSITVAPPSDGFSAKDLGFKL